MPAISIKRNIQFNKSFASLLEALKLVAVSQYHVLEKKRAEGNFFGKTLADFFDCIDPAKIQHPFLQRGVGVRAVIAVTSDAGLAGPINSQVITRAIDSARAHRGQLLVVGERGQLYAQEMRMRFEAFPGVVDNDRHAQAVSLRDHVMKKILSQQVCSLEVVYPKAISLTVHSIESEVLVPFTKPEAPATAPAVSSPIFESELKDILEYLVILYVGERLYQIFGLARIAEQAARFVHLEESARKITDLNQGLTLQYFRRRHEAIDQNMRELFASRKIYAK